MKQRKAAESSHEPEMTLEEINAEIRAARKEKYEDEEKKPHTCL